MANFRPKEITWSKFTKSKTILQPGCGGILIKLSQWVTPQVYDSQASFITKKLYAFLKKTFKNFGKTFLTNERESDMETYNKLPTIRRLTAAADLKIEQKH